MFEAIVTFVSSDDTGIVVTMVHRLEFDSEADYTKWLAEGRRAALDSAQLVGEY